ncbi:MAG: hypothetical protein ACREKI_01470 [Gemmatimonadota bacterium]
MNPDLNFGASLRDVRIFDLPPRLAPEYVRAQRVLPIALEDSTLTVVAPYERDEDVEDDLRVAFNVPRVRWLLAAEAEVDAAIERALVEDAGTVEDLVRDLAVVDDAAGAAGAASAEDLTSLANQPPVVKLVNLVLLEALEARASDVHLECEEGAGSGCATEWTACCKTRPRRPRGSATRSCPGEGDGQPGHRRAAGAAGRAGATPAARPRD